MPQKVLLNDRKELEKLKKSKFPGKKAMKKHLQFYLNQEIQILWIRKVAHPVFAYPDLIGFSVWWHNNGSTQNKMAVSFHAYNSKILHQITFEHLNPTDCNVVKGLREYVQKANRFANNRFALKKNNCRLSPQGVSRGFKRWIACKAWKTTWV